MHRQKVSPNSAEMVAQLEAGRQGEILPSIPDRFGCPDATYFSGNQATRLI